VDDELSVASIHSPNGPRKEGYDVSPLENATDGADFNSPNSAGMQLCRYQNARHRWIELQRRMHEIVPELIVHQYDRYASVETCRHGAENGAYDYVTKTLDPDESPAGKEGSCP